MLDSMLREVLAGAAAGINQATDQILSDFIEQVKANFLALSGDAEEMPIDQSIIFEALALGEDQERELLVAVEGMIAYARNEHLTSFISFNTRLNSLFEGNPVDEASNPLDPQQIAAAFKEAIKPLDLSPTDSLVLVRKFNSAVLRNLNLVLAEANQIFIDNGIIPDLLIDGIAGPRQRTRSSRTQKTEETSQFGLPEAATRATDEQPELFSVVQDLLRATPSSGESEDASPDTAAEARQTPDQAVQVLDQKQLIAILTELQQSISERTAKRREEASSEGTARPMDEVHETLGGMLKKGQQEGTIAAVDQQSADVINLVSMLFEVIWQDESVPLPINELIDRTQISIIKVALADTTFFNDENHPARALLNEFAAASIGWSEVDDLTEDVLYRKIEQIVDSVVTEYSDAIGFFEDLLADFQAFRLAETEKAKKRAQRISAVREGEVRSRDAENLVSEKIEERILGRDLDPFIKDLLEGPWHKFMVLLVLKEGPGSNAWKQATNTIDVLLWSVQPHEQAGDRQRLESVNPRLLNNLRNAFRIASIDQSIIDSLIAKLRKKQEASFQKERKAKKPAPSKASTKEKAVAPASGQAASNAEAEPKKAAHPRAESQSTGSDLEDRFLQSVDNFAVGIWVEFLAENDQSIRCKLAAKISAIDKLIFVNRQGVKVVETTRESLARELQQQTVRIISDGLLFSRALESVIGDLRDSKQTEQSGGAYQAAAVSEKDSSAR
jgi:hypothetical protein|tara:strand:- start:513 stop:2702 length:2190 start_codon:yes stop_codon:yes gene_type:complete